MKRWEAIERLRPHFGDALVLACNGMIGRDLHGIADSENQFYMIGSMGLASSLGLGLALTRPQRRVVVLDGDGNVLMNLGTLANIASARPANLFHIILDNSSHASTGGQRTISSNVPLETVAASCGYRRVWRVEREEDLAEAAEEFFRSEGPVALLVRVEPGNQPKVPRVELSPDQITARFRAAAQR